MAKAEKSPSASTDTPPQVVCPVDVHELAASLFARSIIHRAGQIQTWKVAADCYAAANEFARVATLIAGGASPDEIQPPESPAASQ